jgi:hypothetical protein
MRGGSLMNRVIQNVPAVAYGLLGLLALPSRLAAQTPAPPSSPPALGGIAALGIIVALLVVVGIGVKLYDVKRKREEQGVALQARVSDALLEAPELARLPLVAVVQVPFWRPATAVVTVRGHVPTPELHETAMRIVREKVGTTWPSARTEDSIVVDRPRMQHVAA